jgi:monoamine oxidase
VQGYHAADASDISVEALQEIERESQEVNAVEGAQFFRGGQSQFVSRLVQEFAQPVLLRHCVRGIRWSSGGVEVEFDRAELKWMRAQKVVITIPAGVLQVDSGVASQEGRVMFQPELPKVFVESLSYLKMGTALRMNFLFRRAPWSLLPDLPEFGMILDSTPGALFRVWWKRGHNQIVGWSGGPLEDRGQSKDDLRDHGVQALARLFSLPESQIREDLESTWTHDWNSDPYSRGVYPYVTVGGRARVQRCFEPIENVLYFAGDAECLGAYLGTINGAVKSGTRVARRILGSTYSS